MSDTLQPEATRAAATRTQAAHLRGVQAPGRAWIDNRPLRLTSVALVVLFVVAIIGLGIDDRTLLGDPVWLKPAKFAISSLIYAVSMMVVLTFIRGRDRLVQTISIVTGSALVIEVFLITVQANRGVRSHFNMSSLFNATVFLLMAIAILALWLVSVRALVALYQQQFANRPWGTLLTWALLVTVVGSGLGGAMTTPRSDQREVIRSRSVPNEIGGHAVGVDDGGPGLAIVGWATEGGDLRIGHFLGIHALQILPIVGFAALWLMRRRSTAQQTRMVHILGSGYLALVAIITAQALRGEALFNPGTGTMLAFGILLAGVAAAVAMVVSVPQASATTLSGGGP